MRWVGVGVLGLATVLFTLGMVEVVVTSLTGSEGAAWGADFGLGVAFQLAVLGTTVVLASMALNASARCCRRMRRAR